MNYSTAPRIIAALLLIVSIVVSESSPVPRVMRRKHRAQVEAWSLCANGTDGRGHERFYALFFLSGKLFMVSGNYVHYSMLTLPEQMYTHESSTAVPPFKKVKHSYTSLHEKIGGHSIEGNAAGDTLTIETAFKQLHSRFTVVSRKPAWLFRDVMGGDYDKRQFDWYILPRCSVTVAGNNEGARTFTGYGHFQQFWGKKGSANCDWIVLHTRSGYDVTVAHFPDDKKVLSYLPDDYILVSRPDGTSEKMTAFTFLMDDWWSDAATEKRYPLRYSVVSADSTVAVTVTALAENQTKKIARQEFWYGFGAARGSIDGEEQNGWAYIAPLGKVDN